MAVFLNSGLERVNGYSQLLNGNQKVHS